MHLPRLVREPLRTRLIRAGALGFAVASPWSLSVSQIFAGLALACGALSLREMLAPGRRLLVALWTAYGAASLAGAFLGPLPGIALVASRTLLWGYLPFAVAQAFEGERGASRAELWAALWLASASIASIASVARAAAWIAAGSPAAEAGSMTLSQFLLLASLTAGACALASRRGAPGRTWAHAALVVLTIGMAAQWKRGAWAAWLIGMILLATVTGRRRLLLGVAAAAIVTLAAPSVRERWLGVPAELGIETAGRGSLYRVVAPNLLRDYPWGVGPGATTPGLLRSYDERLPDRLSHLHSTPLQVLAESGPIGLAAWLAWWALLTGTAFRIWRQGAAEASAGLPLAFWTASIALFANGLVEFNFGDTEVMMAASVLAGIVLARRRRADGALHPGRGRL